MSIGQALSAARTAAGLSVQDVSDRTRIRSALVLAIEHDDFSGCGGDVYARGHLRTIAGVVGADPAPLLAEFDAAREASGATVGGAPPASRVFEADTHARRERRGPNWSAAMAFALVGALAYGGWAIVTADESPRPTRTIAEGFGAASDEATDPASRDGNRPDGPGGSTGTPGTPGPANGSGSGSGSASGSGSGDATVDRQAPDVVAAVPRSEVEVVIAAAGETSWIRVTGSGGDLLFEGLVQQGETQTYTDDELITVLMGNAGGLELEVNGVDIGSPGETGDVVTQEFGLEDPATG